jgi:hypothetical protein
VHRILPGLSNSCGLPGIRLRGAQPGEYELVLTVKDDLAGQQVEVREPFEIVSG